MSKILLFGGSFNPPHLAHLEIAKLALKQSKAHELWFVPNLGHPFHKEEVANFEDRAQMLETLIKPFRKFKVTRIEAELSSPNYTIDTIQALEEKYSANTFMWLMGSDQIANFEQWKSYDLLLKKYQIFVYRRSEKDQILNPFIEINSPKIYPISSSLVRSGKLDYCSNLVIQSFVKQEQYLESISKSLISKKRFNHVLSVTKLALDLASAHGMDLHQILIASLFHDCAKEWPLTKMRTWLNVIDPGYLNNPEYMWHARLGADWVKRHLYVMDRDILFAIQHHVHGNQNHKLTQVLYIADKCEETRGYDASDLLKTAFRDLNKGYLAVKKSQLEFLEKDV